MEHWAHEPPGLNFPREEPERGSKEKRPIHVVLACRCPSLWKRSGWVPSIEASCERVAFLTPSCGCSFSCDSGHIELYAQPSTWSVTWHGWQSKNAVRIRLSTEEGGDRLAGLASCSQSAICTDLELSMYWVFQFNDTSLRSSEANREVKTPQQEFSGFT